MQRTFPCSNCGSQNIIGQQFCGNCGTPLNWQTQQQMQRPSIYQQQPGGWSQQPVLVQNTSGQGRGVTIPPEIKGWNWGAFFLVVLWGIFNSVWISLLALIPPLGPIMALVLGVKGNEWAWQSKRWDSTEHFHRTQRAWMYWGIGLVVEPLIILIIIGLLTDGEAFR